MEIGKVPNDILKEIVIDKIKHNRKEVILRPQIGEDCCGVDFGEYICVLSSDPITGAVNEIGKLAVHISCNDIASCGVEPLGLLTTILAPDGTTRDDLNIVMTQLTDTANSLNVDIMGGHTEITAAVNKLVIITTAVGKVLKGRLVTSSGAKEGDSIILTKTAGMEGTAIIAHDREDELAGILGKEFIDKAKSFIDNISTVSEGVIAGKYGANAMHDVTEGGVLGAVWEVAEASDKGVVIYKDRIPIAVETQKICEFFSLNPLRLISSGCMLISCSDGNGLVKELENNGIKATIIGEIVKGNDKLICEGTREFKIDPPGSDELFKLK
ncbi:MAG TPA: AIR synthase family protein [Clostridiales bacterium]|nr:AIR synthase family protein [Clostridiales bacterium]